MDGRGLERTPEQPELSDALATPPPPHPDQRGDRARIHEALFGCAEQEAGASAAPNHVARYRLIERIGGGAIGEVFRAVDPVLERQVAIKTVRRDVMRRDARAGTRMLHEARSLAKLDHPNVVRVLEAGLEDERAWIAMDLVEGANLRDWLHAEPRAAADVLRCLIDAGRGLAAAHAAGLVHRDFKPDNVLIDRDGRAKVGDFGLVRALYDLHAPSDATSGDQGDEARSTGPSGGALLTRDGAVIGTPGYMPPEQLAGDPVGPLSDQFAFCVTAWEALFGIRPFSGRDPVELCAAIVAGPPRRTREGLAGVPRRVERILRRGLHASPSERFPSMEALLRVLERPGRVGLFGGASAVIGLVLVYTPASTPPRCARSDAEAMLRGVWDASVSEEVADAFRRTGVDYAEHAASAVRASLQRRADAWLDAWQRGCIAAQSRSESPARTDRRTSCLLARSFDIAAVSRQFVTADALTVARAQDTVAGLPSVGGCELLDDDPPTVAREVAAEIARFLAESRALRLRGQAAAALGIAQIAESEAARHRAFGLASDAAVASGEALRDLGEADGAVAAYRRAVDLAIESADEGRASRGWFALTQVAANDTRDVERAVEWLAHGQATMRRIAEPGSLGVRAELSRAETLALTSPAEALAAMQGIADAVAEGSFDEEAAALAQTALRHRGPLLLDLGQWDAAAAEYRRQIDADEVRYGPGHPRVADGWFGLGIALDRSGRVDGEDGATAAYGRAREIWSVAWPDGHRDLGGVAIALANVAQRRGDVSTALRLAQDAMSAYRRAVPNERDVAYGEAWTIKGVVEHRLGRYEDAARSHDEARRVYDATSGEHSTNAAIARSNAAEARLAGLADGQGGQGGQGPSTELRRAELQREFERARADLAAALGEGHVYLAYPNKGLGMLALLRGEYEEAGRRLTEALRLCEIDEVECEAVRRGLADAAGGAGPARAR